MRNSLSIPGSYADYSDARHYRRSRPEYPSTIMTDREHERSGRIGDLPPMGEIKPLLLGITMLATAFPALTEGTMLAPSVCGVGTLSPELSVKKAAFADELSDFVKRLSTQCVIDCDMSETFYGISGSEKSLTNDTTVERAIAYSHGSAFDANEAFALAGSVKVLAQKAHVPPTIRPVQEYTTLPDTATFLLLATGSLLLFWHRRSKWAWSR